MIVRMLCDPVDVPEDVAKVLTEQGDQNEVVVFYTKVPGGYQYDVRVRIKGWEAVGDAP